MPPPPGTTKDNRPEDNYPLFIMNREKSTPINMLGNF